jgi:hypothetical protein
MGTWGAGIFSDDTAADVREEYRSHLEDGLSGVEATDKVLHEFRESLDDVDASPPLWLSLAATQMKLGRLEDRVQKRSLQIIDEGLDLARFADQPKLLKARKRVLEKLRTQLLEPQRSPVKVRPSVVSDCDWEAGEIVGFQRSSGEWLPLFVQGIGEKRRSRYPTVCVLNVPFEDVEQADDLSPVRRVLSEPQARRPDVFPPEDNRFRFGKCPDCFTIFGLTRKDLSSSRLQRTQKRLRAKIVIKGDGILPGAVCISWKELDDFFDHYLTLAERAESSEACEK